jgi:hypothetical protein
MENTVIRFARWIAAGMLALVMSAMYATGFFFTHPAIIFGAFVVSAVVMPV